jgi:hypothetical protein
MHEELYLNRNDDRLKSVLMRAMLELQTLAVLVV